MQMNINRDFVPPTKYDELLRLNHAKTDPALLLEIALEAYPNLIALACSFSMEDVAIIHMLMQIDKNARIFALDTGRLPEETFECAENIRRRYGAKIEWYLPDAAQVAALTNAKGQFSFRQGIDERKECCFIRKVQPLQKALVGLEAWITGQRREQSETRADLQQVQIDEAHGAILKLNPLAHWSFAEVQQYVRHHNIPYNRLYDQGYTSIGCAPCTRAVEEGEHERSGRWWWENPEHKECGLHLLPRKS